MFILSFGDIIVKFKWYKTIFIRCPFLGILYMIISSSLFKLILIMSGVKIIKNVICLGGM